MQSAKIENRGEAVFYPCFPNEFLYKYANTMPQIGDKPYMMAEELVYNLK